MADLVEQLRELSELRGRGSLTSKQFETVKARLLDKNPKEVPSPKQELEIELVAMDRAWNARQGEFKVNWGLFWRIPEKNEGTQKARFFLVIGSFATTIFTLIALGVTLNGGDAVIWMPSLFGIAWTLCLFRFFKRWDRIAEDYEGAEAKSQDERAALEARIRALS